MCILQCVRVRWVVCVSSMWRGNRCKASESPAHICNPWKREFSFFFRRGGGPETGADQVQPSPRKKRGEGHERRVLFNIGKNQRVIFSWLGCSSQQSTAEIPVPVPVSLSLSLSPPLLLLLPTSSPLSGGEWGSVCCGGAGFDSLFLWLYGIVRYFNPLRDTRDSGPHLTLSFDFLSALSSFFTQYGMMHISSPLAG